VPTEEELKGLEGHLAAERECYRRMRELSEEQLRIVKDGQTARLTEIVARKQAIVSRLEEISGAAGPLKADWPRMRSHLAPERRDRIQAIIDESGEILKATLEAEEAARKALDAEMGGTAAEIAKLHSGKKMNKAYRQARREQDGRFTDKKS